MTPTDGQHVRGLMEQEHARVFRQLQLMVLRNRCPVGFAGASSALGIKACSGDWLRTVVHRRLPAPPAASQGFVCPPCLVWVSVSPSLGGYQRPCIGEAGGLVVAVDGLHQCQLRMTPADLKGI